MEPVKGFGSGTSSDRACTPKYLAFVISGKSVALMAVTWLRTSCVISVDMKPGGGAGESVKSVLLVAGARRNE